MDTIAKRLMAAREDRGWTQDELASAARVSKAQISRLEGGKRGGKHVEFDTLNKLAGALGIEVDWLGAGKGPRTRGTAASIEPPASLAEALARRKYLPITVLQARMRAEAREIDMSVEFWTDYLDGLEAENRAFPAEEKYPARAVAVERLRSAGALSDTMRKAIRLVYGHPTFDDEDVFRDMPTEFWEKEFEKRRVKIGEGKVRAAHDDRVLAQLGHDQAEAAIKTKRRKRAATAPVAPKKIA